MSFYLVPKEYDFIPTNSNIEDARTLIKNSLDTTEVSHWESDEAQVVGLLIAETQEISCPMCQQITTFENPGAFGEMLTIQSAETIQFKMECCGRDVNLAQIDLTPNTKFSRFSFEVASNGILSSDELKSLEDVLETQLIVIPLDE